MKTDENHIILNNVDYDGRICSNFKYPNRFLFTKINHLNMLS